MAWLSPTIVTPFKAAMFAILALLTAINPSYAQSPDLQADDQKLLQNESSAQDNLDDAEEAAIPDPTPDPTSELKVKEKSIASQQLSQNLEQQLQQLQQSLQTEDAFSSKLGEDYLGYGKLLRESGQFDQSIKALTNALHIAKVNNGIYSIEQRASLRELFNIHYELENTEDVEAYLSRILWVERKNPELSDTFSYELLLKVGNRYIDQFLRNPVAGPASLDLLLRARYHLVTAVRTFGKRPISQVLMPYGELALISYLESKVQLNDSRPKFENSRTSGIANYAGSSSNRVAYVADPFPKGESYLQIYLKKAQKEGNANHVVLALTSLGDLNQLFARYSNAARYYELAWLALQDTDQSSAANINFDHPVLLPEFHYAYQRQDVTLKRESVAIPLLLGVGDDGLVKNVQRADPDDGLEKYFPRARRAVKRRVFRPHLIDAKGVASEQVHHITKVRLR